MTMFEDGYNINLVSNIPAAINDVYIITFPLWIIIDLPYLTVRAVTSELDRVH